MHQNHDHNSSLAGSRCLCCATASESRHCPSLPRRGLGLRQLRATGEDTSHSPVQENQACHPGAASYCSGPLLSSFGRPCRHRASEEAQRTLGHRVGVLVARLQAAAECLAAYLHLLRLSPWQRLPAGEQPTAPGQAAAGEVPDQRSLAARWRSGLPGRSRVPCFRQPDCDRPVAGLRDSVDRDRATVLEAWHRLGAHR